MREHRAKKRFGQNFLKDDQVIEDIFQLIAPQKTDHLFEIGPGEGAITWRLIEHCGHFTAIEIDRELVRSLSGRFRKFPQAKLIEADALCVNFGDFEPKPLRVVGNLPYNVATPLLIRLMEHVSVVQDIHVMLQTEVAKRITASPGSSDYGRLSVMLQYHCQTEELLSVPNHAFRPVPSVNSTVIRLTPYGEKPQVARSVTHFLALVKLAFGQRRKTLSNSLKPLCTAQFLESQGINPTRRAETLSIEEFVRLSNALEQGSAHENQR